MNLCLMLVTTSNEYIMTGAEKTSILFMFLKKMYLSIQLFIKANNNSSLYEFRVQKNIAEAEVLTMKLQ